MNTNARRQWSRLFWLCAYLAMIVVVVWQMFSLRTRLLSELSSPTALQQWEQWRIRADRQSPEAHREAQSLGERGEPVQRRVPKSQEPNLLVLLRDHFKTCLLAAVLFSTLLFVATMFFVRGALAESLART